MKELSQKLPQDDSYEGFSFTRSRQLDLDWSDEDRRSRMNNGSYGWDEDTWWDVKYPDISRWWDPGETWLVTLDPKCRCRCKIVDWDVGCGNI